MPKGNRVDSARLDERMDGLFGAVSIKLFFEKFVHGRIKIEGKTGRPVNPKPPIKIKTAGTFEKKRQFRAAQTEGLPAFRNEDIGTPFSLVIPGHRKSSAGFAAHAMTAVAVNYRRAPARIGKFR
jgi:hypothetical protein